MAGSAPGDRSYQRASAGIGKIDPDRPAKRGDDLILVAHRKKQLRVVNFIRPYMANSEKRIPMDNQKIYLLAELTVRPEFLEEVKTALRKAFIPTLREPGCKALFETSREDHPQKLIFLGSFLLQRHISSTLSRTTEADVLGS